LKHASAAALTQLEPVLAQVRLFPGLKEKKVGAFYLRGSAFLHFHEDLAGLFADAKLDGKAFARFAVSTINGQRDLLAALTQYFKK
jgi:hypothetical protein